ncbi:MAG: hypothetical protein A3H27_16985 [Acidobacteria bacterium RIFCSPLOWO2_02_FULL_59_13]|nr:MAG: hypothetical protein A3H27_16985 [Acidobacteria bacterium RIFCSPLOWO2_02_FULL_59_13]
MVLSEFPTHKVKSLNLTTLTDITFSNKSDGTGSISFGPQHPYQSPIFELIDNVKSVYDTIREAQKKSA